MRKTNLISYWFGFIGFFGIFLLSEQLWPSTSESAIQKHIEILSAPLIPSTDPTKPPMMDIETAKFKTFNPGL